MFAPQEKAAITNVLTGGTPNELHRSLIMLPTLDQMQDATANKHFTNLSEYWSYLVEQKRTSADTENPFQGLHIPLKRGRKARKERNNWTPTLEKALFESPLYSRCASIHWRATLGDEVHRDALFWMPLLARTMGTRESEVCDVLVGSVKLAETDEGPILVFGHN